MNEEKNKKISIEKLAEDLKINIANKPINKDYFIDSSDINRPGIQLAGYYKHFPQERLQVIGKVEHSYLLSLSKEDQINSLEQFLSHDVPAVFIARNEKPNDILIKTAKKYNRFLLTSEIPTTQFINKLVTYVDEILAPTETIYGVLVDVDGVGVLIKGKSGVGKSETALELIRRGHRLIADDVVEIQKNSDGILIGKAPELTKNIMEIRGIGLLDVRNLFGIGAVKSSMEIDMAVYLENWDENSYYDRLGLDPQYDNIFDIPIDKVVVPVKPGKNLSIIIEIAARNYRQRNMGYNTAYVFNENLKNKIKLENEKGV